MEKKAEIGNAKMPMNAERLNSTVSFATYLFLK